MVEGAKYAIGVLVAKASGAPEPPMPDGMSATEATEIVDLVDRYLRAPLPMTLEVP